MDKKIVYFFPQFLFTTSEIEQFYYHQKANIRVVKRLTKNLRKLRVKEIPEKLGIDGQVFNKVTKNLRKDLRNADNI